MPARSTTPRPVTARGVLYVHSATPAVSTHVEWAIAGVVGTPVSLEWAPQPAAPATRRTEAMWRGQPGTAGRLASALLGWPVRFEVTEDPTPGTDGVRYSFTPSLGLFHAATATNGDLLVDEARLRGLLHSGEDLAEGIARLLGTAWDEELEPFRYAGDAAPGGLLTAAV